MRLKACVVALIVNVAIFSPKAAKADPFGECDGLASPERAKDGLAYALPVFVPKAGFVYNQQLPIHAGIRGVAACDLALAHPALLSTHRLRRANLLALRGVHHLAAGNASLAMADFQQSEAMADSADVLFRRSVGLRIAIFRAIAAWQNKDTETSSALLAGAISSRPYYSEIGEIAAKIQFSVNNNEEQFWGRMTGLARVDPNILTSLFLHYFHKGAFSDALRVAAMMHLEDTSQSSGYSFSSPSIFVTASAEMRARLIGMAAYAYVAIGQSDEAASRLDAARKWLTRIKGGPSEQSAAKIVSRADLELRLDAPAMEAELDRWATLVRLRLMLSKGQFDAVETEFQDIPLIPDGAHVDILKTLERARPSLRSTIDPLLNRLGGNLSAGGGVPDLDSILQTLPLPEIRSRVPAYDGTSNFLLTFDPNGYRDGPSENPSWTYVAFNGEGVTRAVATEMALLRACDLARGEKKKGMIVRSRFVQQRTFVDSKGIAATGYAARYEVIFLDPEKIPESLKTEAWRIIDVNQVYADLAPLYISRSKLPQ